MLFWLLDGMRVPLLLVWWRLSYYSNYAVRQCSGENGLIPDSHFIWAQTATNTIEEGFIRKPLVVTRMNEE